MQGPRLAKALPEAETNCQIGRAGVQVAGQTQCRAAGRLAEAQCSSGESVLHLTRLGRESRVQAVQMEPRPLRMELSPPLSRQATLMLKGQSLGVVERHRATLKADLRARETASPSVYCERAQAGAAPPGLSRRF